MVTRGKGGGRDSQGVWDGHGHAAGFNMEIHNFVNILKTTELLLGKSTCTHPPIFIAARFTVSKTWRQLECATRDEWIKKRWYVYTMEHSSAVKKNKVTASAATWIDLESVVLRASQKDSQHMASLIRGIWTWRKMTLSVKHTHTHRDRELPYDYQKRKEG